MDCPNCFLEMETLQLNGPDRGSFGINKRTGVFLSWWTFGVSAKESLDAAGLGGPSFRGCIVAELVYPETDGSPATRNSRRLRPRKVKHRPSLSSVPLTTSSMRLNRAARWVIYITRLPICSPPSSHIQLRLPNHSQSPPAAATAAFGSLLDQALLEAD